MDIATLRQKEIEYCRDHPEYFIETYVHIENKDNVDNPIQIFKLWPAQKEALKSIHEHKLNIVLKARQLGLSWMALAYCSWMITMFSGRTVIALSRSEDEASELVRRLSVILQYMIEFVTNSHLKTAVSYASYDASAMKVVIHFKDGSPDSVFQAFPSGPNAARSFTADILLFDEWAFQQFADDIWTAAYPVINRPTSGKVIGISTIDRGSLFEKLYTDPDNNFNKIFIPWYADPRRTQEWYDETKKALEDKITQEYPATVDEALTVPGGSYFPEVKSSIFTRDLPIGDVIRYVSIDYGLDMLAAHWYTVDAKGDTVCYREYDSPNKTIGEACDILISLTGEEKICLWLAPPDLWSRSQVTGKSRAQLFCDGGINLTKVSNDFAAGCAGMKEYLRSRPDGTSKLMILNNTSPNLYRCLTKIQRDQKRPDVYAKEPHELTHDVDSLRYFCVYWTSTAILSDDRKRRIWSEDMIEDYENANSDDRKKLIEKYGVRK